MGTGGTADVIVHVDGDVDGSGGHEDAAGGDDSETLRGK